MGGPTPSGWEAILGEVVAWLLVMVRVLGLCLTAPGLAAPGLSWRFRLGAAAMLTMVLAPPLTGRMPVSIDVVSSAWMGLGEGLAGAMLGLSAGLILAGARAAGEMVASQAGLSTATFFDPEAGEEATAIGRLYGGMALVGFLAMGGPVAMVRSLAASYEVIPPGGLPISESMAADLFGRVGQTLELSLRLAAPTAMALILAGIAMAWLGRAAPSVPMLILALPIRIVAGLVLILIGLSMLTMLLGPAWSRLLGMG